MDYLGFNFLCCEYDFCLIPGSSTHVQTVKTARWEYSTRPVYGWGDTVSKQKATAGWLAAFPVFEPHWQICMAGGLSTGMHGLLNTFLFMMIHLDFL